MGSHQAEDLTSEMLEIEAKDRLYRDYANAVEAYVKEPTSINWEKKEKAFETYNALIEVNRKIV